MIYNLKPREYSIESAPVYFFTCGRPGRELGKHKPVPDTTVSDWAVGLQNTCGPNIAMVSLLGRKQSLDGKSEFSFYSFCGGFDTSTERKNKLTFQQWLDRNHHDLEMLVCEHPTFDSKQVPSQTLELVKTDMEQLASAGYTIVVMDSGGEQRTDQVCRYVGAQ